MKTTPLICVIYDSITNPAFQGQVLEPLLHKLTAKHAQEVIIISFEKQLLNKRELARFIPPQAGLSVIILQQPTFWTRNSLKKAIVALQPLLKPFSTYHMIARGPIAGYICMHASQPSSCLSLTIQVKGIIADEYAHTQGTSDNILKKPWYALRTYQYKSLEKATYNRKYTKPSITIEAETAALKKYLVDTYHADPYRITLAKTNDTPVTSIIDIED